MLNKSKILSFIALTLFLQTLSGEKLLVEIDESRSFFKLMAKLDNGMVIPLWDPDPLSSGWVLKVDQNSVNPFESGWQREVSQGSNNFSLSFFSTDLSIENKIIISDSGRNAVLRVIVKYFGNPEITLVPKLLIDTIETSSTRTQFITNSQRAFFGEHIFTASSLPDWLRAVNSSKRPSLHFNFNNAVSTKPRSIILSNWQRMKQTNGEFGIRTGREFDFLPFSEGDSGVLFSYYPKQIASGGTYELIIVVGLDKNVTSKELNLEYLAVSSLPQESSLVPLDSGVIEPIKDTQLKLSSINQRLNEIDLIKESIDELLQSNALLEEEAVLKIEIGTDSQKQLREEYESIQ